MSDRKTLKCPHCSATLGKSEGGMAKARLAITMLDADGTLHGPCKVCKRDVVVAKGGVLNKAIVRSTTVVPGLRLAQNRKDR